ncbi:MAG TPA: hypothetical protein VLY63_11810, partial [Anaerolineae bacterium]|nr:hypothetical protein [Anaerolineae bacterium]
MKRLPVHRILGLGVPLGLLLAGCLVLVVVATAPGVAASRLGDPLPGEVEAKVDIKGTKLEDNDADGVLGEDGETGLSGWEIRAYDDLDANGILSDTAVAAGPVKTVTTDASGAYNLAQLASGAYIVCEVAQTDWIQSYPAYPGSAGSADCSAGAPLSASGWAVTLGTTDSTGNDFGNWTPATVSGAKLEDENADGDISEDAGSPLANWTINAYADDGDGVLSAAEFAAGEVSTRTTGTNGGYSFTLDPGDYIFCEEAESGWTQSYPGNNICGAGAGLGAGGWALSLASSDNISN